ncbi:MAG: XRE family transcriptional regulator [Moorea sp. SIO4G2]|uniref:Fis family transcriptional regulator n=1 Tax=unclassified Moorena TaxID=2683338 RepID=UPI0013F7FC55|nr:MULTISPECIES: Fis family transcriptional regulator [unclassified Moorena]NEO11430.1 XRE family transcriptional regulator [Moorena sp. SIO3E8]NEO62385.1 XRE family transcriptional regulator [Moorena sp. SIO4G2]NEP99267.1 XRE family transcriptional regulator [Moorena sp. SIO3F7]
MNNNPYIGSSLDALLEEDNILAEVEAVALKRVLAWQIEQGMLEKGLTKTEMTQVMKTSRAALDSLLDPNNTSVTLSTIERAANALGKRLQLQLVDSEV